MKYLQCIIFIVLISSYSYAQDYPRLKLWSFDEKFSKGEDIILVKGIVPPKLTKEYHEICDGYTDDSFSIKMETELTKDDQNRHLFFIGLTNGFTKIKEFLPPVLKILDNGFAFGPYEFTDSLDVIWLFSNDSKRLFYLGNSTAALRSIYPMQVGLEQYIIVQQHLPTHFGFLTKAGAFDAEDHIDIKKSRDRYLNLITTEFFNFYYSPKIWNSSEADRILNLENQKIYHVLDVLQLKKPTRKINAYIYQDKYEKYFLSATTGLGNVFPEGWEIHTVGTGAIEHESIHLIYDNECFCNSAFISEGVQGYYFCTTNSDQWKSNQQFTKENYNKMDIEKALLDDEYFWREPKYGYPISASFVKFLIDSYGLEKFKCFGRISNDTDSAMTIYHKTLKELKGEWEKNLFRGSY